MATPTHKDQYFASFNEWVNRASLWLTSHEKYNPEYGFVAVCFDAKGRHCTRGADFMRARDEDAFPVRWVWPDQVGPIVLALDEAQAEAVEKAQEER